MLHSLFQCSGVPTHQLRCTYGSTHQSVRHTSKQDGRSVASDSSFSVRLLPCHLAAHLLQVMSRDRLGRWSADVFGKLMSPFCLPLFSLHLSVQSFPSNLNCEQPCCSCTAFLHTHASCDAGNHTLRASTRSARNRATPWSLKRR